MARFLRTGGVNPYLLLTLKPYLSPAVFYLHVSAFALVVLLVALHLFIGWFDFAGTLMKVMNSVMILVVAGEAYLVTLVDNTARFGEPFFLYREDSNSDTRRAFASSIVDGVFYALLPVLMVISNFTAL
jgi:hypothetical protein